MMHPFLYRADCMKHFGFILSPTFHEYITNVTFDEMDEKDINYQQTDNELFTTFNFAKSLKKNIVFMENVLKTKRIHDFDADIKNYRNVLYFSSCFMNQNKIYNIDRFAFMPSYDARFCVAFSFIIS